VNYETITPTEEKLIARLEKLVLESDFYKKYHADVGTGRMAYSVNRRIGRVTIYMSNSCYETSSGYGWLKKTVAKKAEALAKSMSDEFVGDDTDVQFSHCSRDKELYFTFTNYHIPVKIEVPHNNGDVSLGGWSGLVVRFSEVLEHLFHLVSNDNFVVSFHKMDSNGKVLASTVEYRINHVRDIMDNYGACVMFEAARVMRSITDFRNGDGFLPNFARVVANDTGDVYNVEL
jgi:hypothetical protein